jgi:DNA polymerase V
MGVTGLRTYDELNGRADLMIEEDAARQSITTSRSFGEKVEDKEQLGVAISNFAASCAEN